MIRATASILAVLVFLGALSVLTPRAEESGFPHALHEDVFPACSVCHPGAYDPARGPLMAVTAKDCAGCHNGDLLDRVSFPSAPAPNPFLHFDHAVHVKDQGLDCATCHGTPGSKDTWAVSRPRPETCIECHGGAEHLAMDTECRTCHPRLTEAPSLSEARITAFPQPANHAAPEFLTTHGKMAQASIEACATCHAREQCEVCHLNADSVAAIQNLGSDARMAHLVAGRAGKWPLPDNHHRQDWARRHGADAAANAAECATCHTRSSCERCHGGELSVAGRFFEPKAGQAAGVTLADSHPPDHDPAFRIDHGAAAASQTLNCASCHARNFCQDCHAAPSAPGFHPRNFFFRHAADAYARDSDCASCHSMETFCRDCHAGVGLSPSNARTSAYHDASPLWLLQHGEAARQGLEACASCHQQTDCLRCHSAKSGWRINPHGDDFDADRLGDRSLLMCSRCHFSDPRK
jgi:predicted CXXCH cytochrome family protein